MKYKQESLPLDRNQTPVVSQLEVVIRVRACEWYYESDVYEMVTSINESNPCPDFAGQHERVSRGEQKAASVSYRSIGLDVLWLPDVWVSMGDLIKCTTDRGRVA